MMPPTHVDSHVASELEVLRWFPEIEIKLDNIRTQITGHQFHFAESQGLPDSDSVDDWM